MLVLLLIVSLIGNAILAVLMWMHRVWIYNNIGSLNDELNHVKTLVSTYEHLTDNETRERVEKLHKEVLVEVKSRAR